MSDRDTKVETTRTDPTGSGANEEEMVRPVDQLSPEEIERLEEFEDLESLIEEPPDGPLSIVSDNDVPGAPG